MRRQRANDDVKMEDEWRVVVNNLHPSPHSGRTRYQQSHFPCSTMPTSVVKKQPQQTLLCDRYDQVNSSECLFKTGMAFWMLELGFQRDGNRCGNQFWHGHKKALRHAAKSIAVLRRIL